MTTARCPEARWKRWSHSSESNEQKKTADLHRASEGHEIGGDGAGGVEANPLRHMRVTYACAAAWLVAPIALIAAERRLL